MARFRGQGFRVYGLRVEGFNGLRGLRFKGVGVEGLAVEYRDFGHARPYIKYQVTS